MEDKRSSKKNKASIVIAGKDIHLNQRLLDLGYNQITSLPAEIGNLSALKDLRLGSNQLTSLPAELGNLIALEELLLDQNQLTSLPAELGKLITLEWLDLSYNPLTSLPSNFTKWTAKECVEYLLTRLPWSEQNHRFCMIPIRRAIFTILMISSLQNGIPRHPEAPFYKLPKEILYIIFYFVCNGDKYL